MAAVAEQQEKIVEVQTADAGELELEQRGLARIGVHRVNSRRALQRIVEGVAAGAGDDEHRILRGQLQRLPVYGRVFPAGVVDERAGVDRVEQRLVEMIDERAGCLLQNQSS